MVSTETQIISGQRDLAHWLRELICNDIDHRQTAVKSIERVRDEPSPPGSDRPSDFYLDDAPCH